MKVIHVLDHSLPNYDGYAFRSWEIIRFEREHGIETLQVTSPKHAGGKGASEVIEGVEYHRTDTPGGLYALPVLDQVGVVRALRARLLGLVKAHRPDVIHAHSPSLNGMAAVSVGQATGIPVVYEVRSFWEDAAVDAGACREGDLRYRLTRATETWAVRRADHVVPICRGIAGDLAARGLAEEKITIVPNSVDFSRFSAGLGYDEALAARHGLTRGLTLGFAGSFFTFEGLGTLVDAMALLRDVDPGLRLLLVGDGVERADLEARARAAGVDDIVVFTGRVPHSEIESYYGVMDALVYPRAPMRLTELVTPLKPLEAMAYGKPVVASDVGGHRELIEHDRTGLLFRAGDAAALAHAARRLLSADGPGETLSASARAHVEAHRNWSVSVKTYLQLYDTLRR